jgi:hypothetical protein
MAAVALHWRSDLFNGWARRRLALRRATIITGTTGTTGVAGVHQGWDARETKCAFAAP